VYGFIVAKCAVVPRAGFWVKRPFLAPDRRKERTNTPARGGARIGVVLFDKPIFVCEFSYDVGLRR
jgi:hypothetical protein